MVTGKPLHLRVRPLLATAAAAAAAAAFAADSLPAMGGFVATLADEVRELPRHRIAWRTYWTLCWDAYPEARRYELQAVTSEGGSLRPKALDGRCHRLEVAANENRKAEGLRARDLQLALQSGQLAYRVRAVLADGRTSSWSPLFGAGRPVGSGDAPAPQAGAE
jgi:hypothetical protein